MEPEVHIIEKYFQTILKCFTMTNIRLKGSKEIDLLAINPLTGEKYHVESRVATSRSFALRLKDTYTSQGRPYRRGLDFFVKEKFGHPVVMNSVRELFGDEKYSKVLVVFQTHESLLPKDAKEVGIEIWFMADIIRRLKEKGKMKGSRDHVLRIIELIKLVEEYERKHQKNASKKT